MKVERLLKELKKCLGHWNEFAPGGSFPSGKNEDDALSYVVEMMNIEDRNDSDGSGEDDEEEATMKPCIPAFMLFGPYGEHKWGLPICELVSVDTAAIDAKMKEKKVKKEPEKVIVDLTHSDSVRGATVDRQRYIIEADQTRIAADNQQLLKQQQLFESAKELFGMYQILKDEVGMREQVQIMVNCQAHMQKSVMAPPPSLLSASVLSSSSSSTAMTTPGNKKRTREEGDRAEIEMLLSSITSSYCSHPLALVLHMHTNFCKQADRDSQSNYSSPVSSEELVY